MKHILWLFASLILCSFQLPTKVEMNSKIEVYIFLEEDCRISQFYTNTLNELHQQFSNDSVVFTGVFPSQNTELGDMAEFKTKYKIPFDLVFDEGQALTKRFEATITPEVVVYKVDDEKVLYRGRIDNSYFRVGKKRNVVTSNELKHVLSCIAKNKPVVTKWKEAIGCFIKLI